MWFWHGTDQAAIEITFLCARFDVHIHVHIHVVVIVAQIAQSNHVVQQRLRREAKY
jgi:hypothetical protein